MTRNLSALGCVQVNCGEVVDEARRDLAARLATEEAAEQATGGIGEVLLNVAGVERLDIEALDVLVGDRLLRPPHGWVCVTKPISRNGTQIEVQGTTRKGRREVTILLDVDELVEVRRVFREGESIHVRERDSLL